MRSRGNKRAYAAKLQEQDADKAGSACDRYRAEFFRLGDRRSIALLRILPFRQSGGGRCCKMVCEQFPPKQKRRGYSGEINDILEKMVLPLLMKRM